MVKRVRLSFLVAVVACAAAAACSSSPTAGPPQNGPDAGSGGSSGTGGAANASGGASGSGGASASGGAPGIDTAPDTGNNGGTGGASGSGGTPVVGAVQRYIYQGLEGNGGNRIGVYDMDKGHSQVKIIGPLAGASGDLRGITGNVLLHSLFLFYELNGGGRVIAMDLHTDQVLWTKNLQPDADRGEVDPAGTALFVPGGEKFTGPNDTAEYVLDPKTGDVITTFNITPASHDTTIGVSGKYAYMETKSSPIVSMVDIATRKIIKDLTFGNVVGPLVINSSDTLLLGNVMQYFGFEMLEIATGKVTQVHADGVTETPNENPIALKNHALAWKPDETEIWLGSKFHPDVFVYDATVMPPKQVRRFNPGNGYNTVHWITFSIKGDYGYPSPDQNTGIRVQVIDTKTYQPVASMPNSESIMEVDFAGGKVVAVGSQYGIGRKPLAP